MTARVLLIQGKTRGHRPRLHMCFWNRSCNLSQKRGLVLRIPLFTVALLGVLFSSCESRTSAANEAATPNRVVSVVKAARKTLEQKLTVSSELVPFQQIEVYAKESG